jgi:cytochrome c oxidase assembly protein subunit 15
MPRLILLFILISMAVVMGAFTAGLDGGFVYNEFPLMGGSFVPGDALAFEPIWRNGFENPAAAQFLHRWLAIATAAAILVVWWRAPHGTHRISRKLPLDLLAALAIVQVALGIATLLSVVALPLAVLHQAGAVALLTLALWAIHEARSMPRAARPV